MGGKPKRKNGKAEQGLENSKNEQGRWKEAKKESKDTSHRMKEQICKNVSLRLDLSFRLRFLCAQFQRIFSAAILRLPVTDFNLKGVHRQ